MPTTVAPLNPEKMRRPTNASMPSQDVTDGRAYQILLTRQSREHVALIAGVSVEEVDRRLQAAKDYEQANFPGQVLCPVPSTSKLV